MEFVMLIRGDDYPGEPSYKALSIDVPSGEGGDANEAANRLLVNWKSHSLVCTFPKKDLRQILDELNMSDLIKSISERQESCTS